MQITKLKTLKLQYYKLVGLSKVKALSKTLKHKYKMKFDSKSKTQTVRFNPYELPWIKKSNSAEVVSAPVDIFTSKVPKWLKRKPDGWNNKNNNLKVKQGNGNFEKIVLNQIESVPCICCHMSDGLLPIWMTKNVSDIFIFQSGNESGHLKNSASTLLTYPLFNDILSAVSWMIFYYI